MLPVRAEDESDKPFMSKLLGFWQAKRREAQRAWTSHGCASEVQPRVEREVSCITSS